MKMEWSTKHSVNVKIIDEQHQHFISLINDMFEALEKREVESVVDNTLAKLVTYGKFHFKTEEGLLEECGYPGLDDLKAKHQMLLDRLGELMKERETATDFYKYYYRLLDFLKEWLIDHLVGEDKKFSDCLNKHGIC